MSDTILQFCDVNKSFFRCARAEGHHAGHRARPHRGSGRRERRWQVHPDEHPGRGGAARLRADAAQRRRLHAPADPARRRSRRDCLHPPGAQPVHQSQHRRELLHQRFPPPGPAAAARSQADPQPRRTSTWRWSIWSFRRTRWSSGSPPANASWSRSPRPSAMDASIIIFDEPTTSLTARETERLFEIIGRLHAAGKTIIYISHILARCAADCPMTIVVLRDGELVAYGPRRDFTIHSMISVDGRARHRGALSRAHIRAADGPGGAGGQQPVPGRHRAQDRPGAAQGRDPGRVRPDGLGPLGAGADHLRAGGLRRGPDPASNGQPGRQLSPHAQHPATAWPS